jgi:hypothetical protein
MVSTAEYRRETAKPQKETDISRQIKLYLDKCGYFNFRVAIGRIRKGKGAIYGAPVGTPDRFFIYKQMPCFVEVKRQNGIVSPEQAEVHRKIKISGGVVIVAESFDEFLEGLKEI